MGFIGGFLGDHLLRALWPPQVNHLAGKAYVGKDKVSVVLGPDVYQELRGKVIVDFGCGEGHEAVSIAQNGAAQVIGVDTQERFLATARKNAARGVSPIAVNLSHPRMRNATWLSRLTVLSISKIRR